MPSATASPGGARMPPATATYSPYRPITLDRAAAQVGLPSEEAQDDEDDDDVLSDSEHEEEDDDADIVAGTTQFGERDYVRGIRPRQIYRPNEYVTVARYKNRDVIWALHQGGISTRVGLRSGSIELTTYAQGVTDDDIHCSKWETSDAEAAFISEGMDTVNELIIVGRATVNCLPGNEYHRDHAESGASECEVFKVIRVPHRAIRLPSPERAAEL